MILRIESSGLGWRAVLYGPGLPVVEPAPPGTLIRLDIARALRRLARR